MRPPFGTALGRALRRRCPACGRGALFAGFQRLRRSCPACGWVVEREPGAVTGAMYLISIVSQLFAAALFFVVWIFTDWGPWTKLAVALPAIAVFSFVALPFVRALWVAVDYLTDVGTGETRTDAYRRAAYDRDGDDA